MHFKLTLSYISQTWKDRFGKNCTVYSMFCFVFLFWWSSTKKEEQFFEGGHEYEQKWWDEVTERGKKGEKVTIPPDGAGFCIAFSPITLITSLMQLWSHFGSSFSLLLLLFTCSYLITALICLIPRIFFLICFLFLSPASFLLSSCLLNDDIRASVSVCVL